MIDELKDLIHFRAFALTEHLARSAEVTAFDLTKHTRQRQVINVLHTTVKKLKSPMS